VTWGRPPTNGAQNGCHSNGCLTTGPQNLHFIIEYITNAKAYELQNAVLITWPNYGVYRSQI